MRTGTWSWIGAMALALVALAAGAARSWAEPGGGVAPGSVRLAFRERPHVVVHAWARAAIEGSAQPATIDGFDALVEDGRTLEKAIGGARLWGLIDARVVAADDAAGVVAALRAMPGESRMRDGSTRAFRDEAVAYAQQLERVTDAFEKAGWADTKTKLDAIQHDVEGMLARAHPNAMAWIVEKMGWRIPAAGFDVPVDLVWAAPAPGGVTFRAPGGAGCMVGLGDVEGPTRAEVVLHEAMHAVDVMTGGMGGRPAPDADDALTRLRDAMGDAGFDPRSKVAHDAWHTLFFVTAGQAVRACIDPTYVDYGQASTYYTRVGPIAEVERRAWGAYLRGETSMDDAIAQIVADAVARRSGNDTGDK